MLGPCQNSRGCIKESILELQFEPTPVRVFVVWHPKFSEGEQVLRGLYAWLGGASRDLYRRGLGVPVYGWTSSSNEIAPATLPLEDSTLTVGAPLLDGEFLGRQSWRKWLGDLCSQSEDPGNQVVILPWAVHQAYARIPGIGLLHLLGAGSCEIRQFCRRVTEACIVRVRDPKNPKPLRIFISYARKDGLAIASDVRRALQGYGHLSVFFDEHDLQPGQQWRHELADELKQGAAMFAIVTDAYASRAWCREELRQFREPQRESNSNRWTLRPVFILDNLSGSSTRSMFEVGNAPAARWDPERATEVVDELLREVLFSESNRIRALRMQAGRALTVVNWVPDTWTLLQVLRTFKGHGPRQIAYPGDGLPRIEVDRLSHVLPRLSLYSFEQLAREAQNPSDGDMIRERSTGPRLPVLLSVSDPPQRDLIRNGLCALHLDDAAVRIARCLLSDDFDVMYGGRPRSGFTEGFQDDSGAVVIEPRLINYIGWPYSEALGATQVADEFGITRYVKITSGREKSTGDKDALVSAEAASYTRHAAINDRLRNLDGQDIERPLALIGLGGQLTGFTGFLPGVAEEIAFALEAGIAVYVLGGFGGAAQQVAAVLAGNQSDSLTVDSFMANDNYKTLLASATSQNRQSELAERASWLNTVLRSRQCANGLDHEENCELWSTLNLGRAIALVSKGLRRKREAMWRGESP